MEDDIIPNQGKIELFKISEKMKYLIIGASAAGLAAAETLKKINKNCQTTILFREKKPYSRVLLPYLLAGDVVEQEIFLQIPEGVELISKEEVIRIDPKKKEVFTTSGEAFTFDKLLIATGAYAVRPELEGINLPFVFTVRELSNIQKMRKFVMTGNRAIIAGGGLISMRIGEALHRLGMKITFVIKSNRVLSQILDKPASVIVEQVLAEHDIKIIKKDEIIKIAEGKVCLYSGRSISCSLIVFGKGVRPNVHFLKGSGVEVNRGIVVNEYQQTNLEDIYAAGDVAETIDITYGEKKINALWPVAREQGHIAALNMASIPTIYEGSVAHNTLEIFGLPIFTAGIGHNEEPGVVQDQGKSYYHKLVLNNGVLKGAIFIGKVINEGLYLFLMKKRLDVSKFIYPLLTNKFKYPNLVYQYIHTSRL